MVRYAGAAVVGNENDGLGMVVCSFAVVWRSEKFAQCGEDEQADADFVVFGWRGAVAIAWEIGHEDGI